MAVLGLLKKVKVQTLSFEKHPCSTLDLEMKIHYLNGLALITNEDENICEKEREYLSILIHSFDLDKEQIEEFVEFAQNPDEESILDMMQSFSTKDIKYNFMVDCMMMAGIDGNFDESEKAVIEQYFEMFKITKKEADDLKYIFKMFHTQDGNALFRYFKRNEYMKIELFQYLLDYYKIDMAYELVEDEKKILTFDFFKPTFEQGKLAGGATEIMTKLVNNAQFCIFLNSAFMSKAIEIDGNDNITDSKSKDLLMDLENSNINFSDNTFFIDSNENEEKKVTGLTYVMAELFIEWVSLYNKENYLLLSLENNDLYFNIKSSDDKVCDELCNIIMTGNTKYSGYIILTKGMINDLIDYGNFPIIKPDFYSNNHSFRMMKLLDEVIDSKSARVSGDAIAEIKSIFGQ